MPDNRRTRGGSGRPGGAPRPAGRPASVRRARPASDSPRPSSPVQPEPKRGSGGGSRLTGRAAVLFLVLLVLLISYASSLRAWLQQRDDTAHAQAEVAEAEQNIEELEEQKERLNDPSYIESQARERFGWLRPGETGYTVLDENGDVVDGSGGLSEPSDGGGPDDPEWYAKVWGSVQAAGEEPSETTGEDDESEKPYRPRVVRPEGARR